MPWLNSGGFVHLPRQIYMRIQGNPEPLAGRGLALNAQWVFSRCINTRMPNMPKLGGKAADHPCHGWYVGRINAGIKLAWSLSKSEKVFDRLD